MYDRTVISTSRRFLKVLGFSLVQAILFGSLVGLLVYFRVPRSVRDLEEEDQPWHVRVRDALEEVELRFYDWRARDLGKAASRPEQVVLVTIDDETLANARKDEHPGISIQPWPREIVGGVADRLIAEGAALVVLDQVFSDVSPSACPVSDVIGPVQAQTDDDALRAFLDRHPGQSVLPFTWAEARTPSGGTQPRPYRAFIDYRGSAADAHELVRRILSDRRPAYVIPDGRRVQVWAGAATEAEGRILARRFEAPGGDVRELSFDERAYQLGPLDLLLSLSEVHVEGLDPTKLIDVRALTHPIAPLLGGRSVYGSSTVPPDLDGQVRGISHLVSYVTADGRTHVLPSIPLAAAMQLAGTRELRFEGGRLHVGDRYSLPMDETGYSLIRWDASEGGRDGRGPIKRVVPAWRVVVNMFDKVQGVPPHYRNSLDGKTAILAQTHRDVADLRPTPIGRTVSAAIAGQALANLLSSAGIARVRPSTDLLATMGLAFVGAFFALTFIGSTRSMRGRLVYLLSMPAAGGAYLWYARHLFVEQGLWVTVAAPLLAMLAAFSFTSLYAQQAERKVLEFIYEALGRAISPEVSRKVASDLALLRPDRRLMTVFVSDIEGFAALSDQLPPDRLVELLNEYWNEMTAVIRSTQGQVDKYVGDALTAFWGAPLRTDRHAQLACEAALQMREALRRRQQEWEERFGYKIEFRAGVDTGEVVVGDMGSTVKPNYTVLGEVVSLASRLERECRVYGVPILVGEGTARVSSDRYLFREVDRVRVKGRPMPILIFELIGRRGEAGERPASVADFERGLIAYHERRFLEAYEVFSNCATDYQDPVAALYLRRCLHYLDHPPPSGWDGVYELAL